MDPHMTKEDAEYLDNGPHRRLYQSLSPPKELPVKKKKLVNFKISRRRRYSSDGNDDSKSTRTPYSSIRDDVRERKETVTYFDDRRESTRRVNEGRDIKYFNERKLVNLDERREDVLNFNDLNERDVTNFSEREHIRNFHGRRNGIRNLGEPREAMINDNERREELRNLIDRKDEFNNDNVRGIDIRSLTDRREDCRNDNLRQEAIRCLNERREGFRDVRERKEDFRDIRERDALRDVRERRNAFRDTKERRADFRDVRERQGDYRNIHEKKDFKNIEVKEKRTEELRSPKERREGDRKINERQKSRDTKSHNPSNTSPITEYHRPIFRHTERSPSGNPIGSPDEISLKTTRSPSTSSWEKIRLITSTNAKSTHLNNVVEIVTKQKRRAAVAPSIWTPAVPRSVPTPRPANFQNQEEPGSRSYIIAFISRATQSRARLLKRQFTLPYRKSQSHHEWEARGKMYVNWLKDVVSNPHLQEGLIMKGLEIGGVYQEVVSWLPELLVTCPSDPSQWARCFIVVGFKTLDGELNEKMETLWKEWTGALYIYCNIDDDLGLKKLSFYRRSSPHQVTLFSYLLIVEVDTVTQENSLLLLDFTYRMRMKNMTGYISVYQEHHPDGAVDVVPGGSPVPSTAQAAAAAATATAAASTIPVETSALDLTRINI
ncbi:apical junction molecule-like isoform X2 [Cherax quadricarinatus]|uniref:apical junction molecule-like isoform X2 n=1 Tax=Cherax quadricarinatus TaxID=27406 RepID=UPI00387E392A